MSQYINFIQKAALSTVSAAADSKVTVDVPTDVWEGEGAILTCSPDVTKDNVPVLFWYKDKEDEAHAVYVYARGDAAATKGYNSFDSRAVGQWVGDVHQLSISKTILTDEGVYICVSGAASDRDTMRVNLKPEGVTITGIVQSVVENVNVQVTCDVSRVKPEGDIYWRKGSDGQLETGTNTNEKNSDQRTFHLQSTYTVSFSRSDHNIHLYCLVTRPGDSADVLGSFSKVVNVLYSPTTKVTQKSSGHPTEGHTVTLTCDIKDGNPRDDIKKTTWRKGRQELKSGRINTSGRDLTIGSLDHSKDDGSYTCAAENTAGEGEFGDAFQLEINYKPTVSIVTPAPARERQPVTITCQSQGARPPVKKVTWKKGQEVISGARFRGGTVQTPSLTIRSTARSDAGQYSCQLDNDVGHDTKTVTLQVWYLPSTQVIKSSRSPFQGHSVTLTCDIKDGNPIDDIKKVKWRKEGQDVTSSGGRDLTIGPLDHSKDDGSFTCAAENAAGEGPFGDAYQLDVLYKPTTEVSKKSSGHPTEGHSVTLMCDIKDGNPRDDIMKVMWKKGGQELKSGRINTSGQDLTINSLDHSMDYGSYTCAAENAAGNGSFGDAFEMNVYYPPTTQVIQKSSRHPTEGNSVTLTCDIKDGNPRDNITKVMWKKGGQERKSGRINTSGRDLNINSLDHSKDDGSYTCAAENAAGMGPFGDAFQMNVYYRPLGEATMDQTYVIVAVGGTMTLTCLAPSDPGNPAASWFYWRKDNSDFHSNSTLLTLTPSNVKESGKYSCVAGNWLGQSNYSDWTTVTVQVPPESPTHFIILSNSTSVALTLQWQPGVTGSDPQVFAIEYTAGSKTNVHYSASVAAAGGKQQQLTVVGLVPETLYKFMLFAHNNNADVIKSGLTSASGWTAASPELKIETVDITSNHMIVTWSKNSNNSSHRRSTFAVVSVVIFYQRDAGNEYRYPPEGSVDAKHQAAAMYGEFDTEATYNIWLKVYEGQLTFPSKIIHPVKATAIKEKGCSCSTFTVVAAVLGCLLVINFLALVFYCIYRTRQQSHCNEDVHQTRQATKREPSMEMSDNFRLSTEVDDTKHYQHLSVHEKTDTAIPQGTYASLDKPEATEDPVPGAAYENIDAISKERHSYVNTPKTSGETAEYAEVP